MELNPAIIHIGILLGAALLASWGATVMYAGQLPQALPYLRELDARGARLCGVIALCEAAAGISLVLGHPASALVALSLTLPLLLGVICHQISNDRLRLW